jgi:tetratricopeptide (TPR) repeat protein
MRSNARLTPCALLCVPIVAALCSTVPRPAAAAQAGPTFAKEVAPIIWSRCASCHRPGQVAPFSLLTYDDVKRRSGLIATVTAKRLMPPWKPQPGQGDFAGERRLTDGELAVLQRWIADGAPEGDRALLPAPPVFGEGWQLGTPDLVVSMPAPYSMPADGGDVFRTFVVPIATDRPRFVRALEFRPDNARVVHHANLGVDRTKSSRALDARDAEPGYSGSMVQDARYPEGQLLGWTPGQAAHAVPDGMQWRLEPGSDLVMQLHLQPTGKREALTISVGLYFTDAEPTRTPLGLRLGSETIDIPAGAARYAVDDRYVLPVDVDVLAIQPHAHNLARQMHASATLPDGRSVPLIAIDDWDFRWQDVYRYVKPIALPRGTTIAMQYVYDNSGGNPRNPHRPPARVVWGQNTTDEMGDLWIQLTPRAPRDFAILNQDFRRKANAEDLAAYTKLLANDPDNPLRHDAVAGLYFESGLVDQAIEHYTRSLQLNPASASTHYNLGIALAARSRRDEAIAHFEQALRLDSGYAQAHNNLGALLYLAGRPVDALEHYRQAIAIRPDNVEARTNLGALLAAAGRPAEALEQYRSALAIRPDDAKALAGAAWIRATAADAALRNGDEAVTLAERAAQATGRRDLATLDALAAAYAEVGRFDDAVAAAEDARRQATDAGRPEIAARFTERAALYRQRRPYRMVSAGPK